MDLIDNVNHRLGDDLKAELGPERRLQIAASRFSIYAFDALREALSTCGGLDFLFTEPSFLPGAATDAATPEVRRYHLQRPAESLTAPYEIRLKNRLTQKAVARDCAAWLREHARMRSNVTSLPMQQFGLVTDPAGGGVVYHPLQGFTAADLGYERGESVSNFITRIDAVASVTSFRGLFDQVWNDPQRTADVVDAVCDHIARVYRENPPRRIYHLMLLQLFREHLESLSPDDAANRRTGYRETMVWQKLYDFQADAAHGLIQKLQTYDGCVLADSVGLGKTFTALAVVKYYELRNKRVLVLCPRKLAENWTNYNSNYRTNPFHEDRFGYDVLCHTDLLRDRGESLGIQLDRIAWGNYDLVVIDESHNFRNVNPSRRRETRYDRLLQRVIRDGVRTKVLMLSATPVNNRFADLKNQLLLAYGGDVQRLREHLPGGHDVEDIFRRAQAAFNHWSELPTAERTPQAIMDLLDFDFFDLLDRVTIARSRRQIERFYDTAKLGGFPERLPPKAVHSRLTSRADVIDFNEIFAELSIMNLAVYTPLAYVLDSRRADYEALFDTELEGGRMLPAAGREAGLRALMTTNLLKRLESSVHAFRLTLTKLTAELDDRLAKITTFEADGTDAEVDGPTYEPGLDDYDEESDPAERRTIRIKLSDMDLPRWRDDLTADRERVGGLTTEMEKVTPEVDSKLQDLRQTLQSKLASPINPGNRKVLVFTAFADTAVYLYDQLSGAHHAEHGLHVAVVTGDKQQIDNTLRPNRKGRTSLGFAELLTLFSPRSKEKALLLPDVAGEIDLLIATDCISEGQNLQDCDCLVNYDIHWNPVRIVQRFGRIDRIGSTNARIQLINHWPDITLDEYINLKARVENRMVIVDATATADDNPLDAICATERSPASGAGTDEDSYRGEQLRRMHEEVVELEDLRTGVSITDLGLNDYHLELQGTLEDESDLPTLPAGLHAVVRADSDRGLPAGVVFALRQRGGAPDGTGRAVGSVSSRPQSVHRLHPHYLVYVAADGSVVQTHTDVKPLLDVVRMAARDEAVPVADACGSFNTRTDDGRDMTDCSRLLDAAVASVIGRQAAGAVDALFDDGGLGGAGQPAVADDFELMSFLVVEDMPAAAQASGT